MARKAVLAVMDLPLRRAPRAKIQCPHRGFGWSSFHRCAFMSPYSKIASITAVAVLLAACSQSTTAPATSASSTDAPQGASAEDVPATAQMEPEGTRLITPADLEVDRAASSDSCNIEAIGSEVFATTTAPIEVVERAVTIGGWVLSSSSKKPGVPAQLRFLNAAGDAGATVRITSWNARPDVITDMGAVGSGDVGFVQAADLSALPAGQYQVSVAFEDGDRAFSCEKGRMIVLK